MEELPEGHEIVSSHPNEEDARKSAYQLLWRLGGLPPGWNIYLNEASNGGVDVVKYCVD